MLNKPLPIKDKANGAVIYRSGEKQAIAQFRSLTGKIYTFTEKAVLTKRGEIFRYWQMPEVQNYPVQGLASDIVATQVGKIYKVLRNHPDRCRMIKNSGY